MQLLSQHIIIYHKESSINFSIHLHSPTRPRTIVPNKGIILIILPYEQFELLSWNNPAISTTEKKRYYFKSNYNLLNYSGNRELQASEVQWKFHPNYKFLFERASVRERSFLKDEGNERFPSNLTLNPNPT